MRFSERSRAALHTGSRVADHARGTSRGTNTADRYIEAYEQRRLDEIVGRRSITGARTIRPLLRIARSTNRARRADRSRCQ